MWTFTLGNINFLYQTINLLVNIKMDFMNQPLGMCVHVLYFKCIFLYLTGTLEFHRGGRGGGRRGRGSYY